MTQTLDRSEPTLLLIRGVPGSGKTFIASALQQKIGVDNVQLLDPDVTDYKSNDYLSLSKSLAEEGVDKKFHPYRYLRAQAHQAILKNKVIIWNQAFTNLVGLKKTVINLTNFAKEHDADLTVLIVEVLIDHDTALERIKLRAATGGHDVPTEKFEQFLNDFRSFKDEDFNVITVSGADDVDLAVSTITNAIESQL